jgi:hypothetical protein
MLTIRSIGTVTYASGGIVAELFSDRTWHFTIAGKPSPAMARLLAARYLDHYRGPQDGNYGERILQDYAATTNGTLVLRPQPRVPRGAIP